MSSKYPSNDGWKKDGSYTCWDKYDYVHFDYRPSGVDKYMGSTVEGYNIGICSEPSRYDKREMNDMVHSIVREMGHNIIVDDLTYIGTYPFNDKWDRISSDVWVARLTYV